MQSFVNQLHETCLSHTHTPHTPHTHTHTHTHTPQQGANTECLKALIAFGADVNPLNGHGLTPLDLAIMSHPAGERLCNTRGMLGSSIFRTRFGNHVEQYGMCSARQSHHIFKKIFIIMYIENSRIETTRYRRALFADY